jgi:hypothetical protein
MKTNQIIDQALKIQNGDKLDIRDLNDLVTNLILSACDEKEIKASAKRIAQDKYSYELQQMENESNRLIDSLTGSTERKSPLDV